jgi:hypothetical protein
MQMRARWLARLLFPRLAPRREPDVYIGGRENPYILRWYLIPRNRVFNVYLHHFRRSDDDRALHDHPWASISLCLEGHLYEWVRECDGSHLFRKIGCGQLTVRGASFAHRIEVDPDHLAWTLFVTGPKVREWGFWCPQGWRHWRAFTGGPQGESIGRGCD